MKRLIEMKDQAMTDDELRRLAEAATPGPWAVERDHWSPDVYDTKGNVLITTQHSDLSMREDAANAAYIAAACNAVPGLLDRLTEAEERGRIAGMEEAAGIADYAAQMPSQVGDNLECGRAEARYIAGAIRAAVRGD